MDLRESTVRPAGTQRHPWELARRHWVLSKMAPVLGRHEDGCLLDVGCGDGFVLRGIARRFPRVGLVGVDPALPAHAIAAMTEQIGGGCRLLTDLAAVADRGPVRYVTLLDVLEHVEDDGVLLSEVVDVLAPGGHVWVTVPASQAMFGDHDVWLGHHRRYELPGLVRLLERAGLEVAASGHLFAAPLAVRAAQRLAVRVGIRQPAASKGIGGWRHGSTLTTFLTWLLILDTTVLDLARRGGLRIPGLSCMAICRKPR